MPIPPEARVHDLTGLTITAGWIDLDLRLETTLPADDASREGRDAQYVVAALAPGGAAVTGLTPRVEGPSFLRNHARLDDFTAIYLLNLERLDESEIEALERYVRDGGGVAFFLGQRSTGQFFTSRLYRNGAGLFPLPLSVPTDLLVDRLEKTPDLVISDHPIFEIFAGERNSFLNSVLIQRYFAVPDAWKPDPEASTRVIARLRNGAPLVVEKRLGEGRVVAFLTPAAPGSAALGRWNNWGRNNPSFVVVMLELQAYLAQRRDAAQHLVGQRLVIPLDPKQYEPQVRFQVPDDDTLRAVANKGGVIGIYFMPFLGDTGSPWATAAMVLDHIDHALKTCGEDHVGIGTDGPIPTVRESQEFLNLMKKVEKQRAAAGVQAPGEQGRFPYIQELNQPRRIEQVAEGMHQRGHPDRVIEKVVGANFYRAFSEIWV